MGLMLIVVAALLLLACGTMWFANRSLRGEISNFAQQVTDLRQAKDEERRLHEAEIYSKDAKIAELTPKLDAKGNYHDTRGHFVAKPLVSFEDMQESAIKECEGEDDADV